MLPEGEPPVERSWSEGTAPLPTARSRPQQEAAGGGSGAAGGVGDLGAPTWGRLVLGLLPAWLLLWCCSWAAGGGPSLGATSLAASCLLLWAAAGETALAQSPQQPSPERRRGRWSVGRRFRAERALALSKCLHPRLAAGSPAAHLPSEVVQRVSDSLDEVLRQQNAFAKARREQERADARAAVLRQFEAISAQLAAGAAAVHMDPAPPAHRFLAHSIAEEHGLLTSSEGQGVARHVVVTRPPLAHRLLHLAAVAPRRLVAKASRSRHLPPHAVAPATAAAATAVLIGLGLWAAGVDAAGALRVASAAAKSPWAIGVPFLFKVVFLPAASRLWRRAQESHRWHTAPHSDDLIVIIASVEPAALQREASGGEPCSAADVRYDSFGGLSLSKLYKAQAAAPKLLKTEAWRSTAKQERRRQAGDDMAAGQGLVLLYPSQADTFRLLMPIGNAINKPFRAGTLMKDMGMPVVSHPYVFGLANIHQFDDETGQVIGKSHAKLRVVMVQESALLALKANLRLQRNRHKERTEPEPEPEPEPGEGADWFRVGLYHALVEMANAYREDTHGVCRPMMRTVIAVPTGWAGPTQSE